MVQSKLVSIKAQRARWCVVGSGKGGTGKTTTSFNLAVFGAHAGFRVCLVDLDSQPSLTEWHNVRVQQEPNAPEIAMWSGAMSSVSKAIAEVDALGFDLVIADTPPALADAQVERLLRRSDFVIVPTTQGVVDLRASIAWMTYLRAEKIKAAFLINRAQRTYGSYQRAKLRLIKFGELCPIDIRLLDDVAASGDLGLGVLELAKSKAAEDYQGLFDYVIAHLGIGL